MDKLSKQHERVGQVLQPVIDALVIQNSTKLVLPSPSSGIVSGSSSTPSDGSKVNLQGVNISGC